MNTEKKPATIDEKLRAKISKAVTDEIGDPATYVEDALSRVRSTALDEVRTVAMGLIGVDMRWGEAEPRENGLFTRVFLERHAAELADWADKIVGAIVLSKKHLETIRKEAGAAYADALTQRACELAKQRAYDMSDEELLRLTGLSEDT